MHNKIIFFIYSARGYASRFLGRDINISSENALFEQKKIGIFSILLALKNIYKQIGPENSNICCRVS